MPCRKTERVRPEASSASCRLTDATLGRPTALFSACERCFENRCHAAAVYPPATWCRLSLLSLLSTIPISHFDLLSSNATYNVTSLSPAAGVSM